MCRLTGTKPSNVWQASVPAGRLLSVKCCDAQQGSCRGTVWFTAWRADEPERQAVTTLAYKPSTREITAFSWKQLLYEWDIWQKGERPQILPKLQIAQETQHVKTPKMEGQGLDRGDAFHVLN